MGELHAYLCRGALAPVCTNIAGTSKSPKHDHDPLEYAVRIVENLEDTELAAVAYQCLYRGANTRAETALWAKKHQHYIIQLTSARDWKGAYRHLGVLYGVFSGNCKQLRALWSVLLRGIDTGAQFLSPLVTSFHFLVLQTVLQAISCNLQTVAKGQGELGYGLFREVASLFLAGSNAIKWMETETNPPTRTKYLNNCVKMLSGFVKLGDFLCLKKSSCSEELLLSVLLLKMKLHEMKVKAGIETGNDLVLPESSKASTPFMKDLLLTLSQHLSDRHAELIGQLQSRLRVSIQQSHLQNSTIETEAVATDTLPSHLSLVLSSSTLSSHSLADLLLFVKSSDIAQTTLHIQILSVLEENISRLSQQTALTPLIDVYLLHMRDLSQDPALFNSLLTTCIPALSSVIYRLKMATKLRQLEELCVNNYRNFSKPESLEMATRILIRYACLEKNAGELTRAISRAQRYFQSLAKSNSGHSTTVLAYEFATEFSDRLTDKLTSLIKVISKCFLEQPSASGELWFGRLLTLNSKQKTTCFTALLNSLDGQVPFHSSVVRELVSAMHLAEQSAKLQCLHQASSGFKVDFDLSDFSPTTAYDNLRMAEIHLQSLSSRSTSFQKVLKLIQTHFIAWINYSGSEPHLDEQAIALRILEELHCLGYYELTAQLACQFDDEHIKLNHSTRLNVKFALLDSCLKLSRVSKIPSLLHEAGDTIRIMHMQSGSVDCNFLIKWKLIQLEYFVAMLDENKITLKLVDIEKLILKYPEYDLKADSTSVSIERRLECLQLLAKFLMLASESNEITGSYILALKNLKLAIKILNSILRKLDTSKKLFILKFKTEIMILSSYHSAFMLCRHLGLLKDASFYLGELEKLNDLVQNPAINALYDLHLAMDYASIDKRIQSEAHLVKASGIADGHFHILRRFSLIAKTFMDIKFNLDQVNIEMCVQQLHELSTEFEFGSNIYEALGDDFLLEVISELDYLMCSRLQDTLSISRTKATVQKRAMLKKAISVVTTSLNDREMNSYFREKIDSAINSMPSCASQEPNKDLSSIQQKLLDCKEILHNCFNEDRCKHLELRKAKDVSALFNRCVFLLSLVAQLKPEGTKELLNTVYSLLDLPKALPFANQQKVVETLGTKSVRENELIPIFDSESQLASECGPQIVNAWKQILPKKWVVVSLDICPVSGDVVLSRLTTEDDNLQVYKLPLRRKLRTLSFKEISLRLRKIIEQSNSSTTHEVTSKVRTKDDRKTWWRLRFELDLQLGALLNEVEKDIIGSFSGIFEMPDRQSDCYLEFDHELQKIWRSVTGGKDGNTPLSKRLVDLFYCAKPFDEHGAFEFSSLKELIEFASSETAGKSPSRNQAVLTDSDLESQLETLYHSFKRPVSSCEHLVLVPSSSCSSFPWESMSILRDRSVSRVPSVGLLMSLLEKYSSSMRIADEELRKGIFYVVNPGEDLKRTQEKFEPLLTSTPHARGLCGKLPSEEYLMSNMFDSGLYLYLGHGGGEQYIRASSLLKAKFEESRGSLPPAILMGCSSGAYQEYGELEPTSNVFTWLVCGSPMVVANLWDITDRDIDKLSETFLGKWGFLNDEISLAKGSINIGEAVGSSRAACTLQYLNGAAPIVHGLPLKFH